MASQASLDIEKLTIVFDTKHQRDITRLLCYCCGTSQAFIRCDLCSITTCGECSREFAYRYEGIAFFLQHAFVGHAMTMKRVWVVRVLKGWPPAAFRWVADHMCSSRRAAHKLARRLLRNGCTVHIYVREA